MDRRDRGLKKTTVKQKRDIPTANPTAKKAQEAGGRSEKPVTRKQESEIKREDNNKKPKKGQTELPQRKIAFEIVELSGDDDDAAKPDPKSSNRTPTNGKGTGIKSDPSKISNQGAPEDDQQTAKAEVRKIECLGPRSALPEKYKSTFDKTRKNLKRLIDHQNYQFEFAKGRKSPGEVLIKLHIEWLKG